MFVAAYVRNYYEIKVIQPNSIISPCGLVEHTPLLPTNEFTIITQLLTPHTHIKLTTVLFLRYACRGPQSISRLCLSTHCVRP